MERLAMDVAGPYPITSQGTNTASWWGAISQNGLSASPFRTRRPRQSLGSWYTRSWHDMEHSKSYIAISDGFIERSFRTLDRCLKAACWETKQEWDELVPLILMSYRATPQASTGVTPNMMMLGRQTQLLVQAMYRAPMGADKEEKTVSEYMAALQEGLRASYRHAREGLQRAALHQKHDYDGKVQRREYKAGELVWIHDITLGRNRGTKLQFSWFGTVLITKVLDRGRIVVHRKQDKQLTVVHVDCLEGYRGAAVDDGGAAWMCSCLKESKLRERPGTSREEGTLPRRDRPVLRPRLNWEGGAAWNDQNWYHAGSSELGP